jgi:hypothetical protein
MAGVEDSVLRRFARERFIQHVAGDDGYDDNRILDILRLTGGDPPFSIEESLLAVGTLVERRGWLEIGAQIGYFEAVAPLDDEDRKLVAEAAGHSGKGKWPAWFRRFGAELDSRSISRHLPEGVPVGEPATLAIFQAALILADEFRDPLLASLQRSLQVPQSPLDEGEAVVSAEEVLEAIAAASEGDSLTQQSLPRCVGGFLSLVDLLAAFDNLFPELEDLAFIIDGKFTVRRETDTENAGRAALSKVTANLLSWRLNLWDETTVRRLLVVSNAFWDLCGREFGQSPEPKPRWSALESRRALVGMLERWRDRADAEPEDAAVNLGIFEESVDRPATLDVERGLERS